MFAAAAANVRKRKGEKFLMLAPNDCQFSFPSTAVMTRLQIQSNKTLAKKRATLNLTKTFKSF